MNKIFQTYIEQYEFCTTRSLDSNWLLLEKDDFKDASGFYSMHYAKSWRIDHQRTCVVDGVNLEVCVTDGKDSFYVFCDIVKEAWGKSQYFREMFQIKDDLYDDLVRNKLCTEIIDSDECGQSFTIVSAIIRGFGGDDLTEINIYQLMNIYDIDGISENEVVYFGKTDGSLRDRTRNHDKWLMFYEGKPRDRDLLVYFLKPRHIMLSIEKDRDHSDPIANTFNEHESLLIAESCFIHMFKPRFCKQHVDIHPFEVGKIGRKVMEEHGVLGAYVEYDLDGQAGAVKGGQTEMSYSHRAVFPVNPNGPMRVSRDGRKLSGR